MSRQVVAADVEEGVLQDLNLLHLLQVERPAAVSRLLHPVLGSWEQEGGDERLEVVLGLLDVHVGAPDHRVDLTALICRSMSIKEIKPWIFTYK